MPSLNIRCACGLSYLQQQGDRDDLCPRCERDQLKFDTKVLSGIDLKAAYKTGKTIEHYRSLVQEIAEEPCFRATSAFRGECGRDGQPQDGWCFVCRAKVLVENAP